MDSKRRKQIVNSFLGLMSYLSCYGVDKYNTMEDLIVLELLKDILESGCEFSECQWLLLTDVALKITHNNPHIKYCRDSVSGVCKMGDYDDAWQNSHFNTNCNG